MNTITLTTDALAQIIADAIAQAQVAAAVVGTEPASQAPETSEFVTWLHETAEARHARKASNRKAAAWMRGKNIPITPATWDAVKHGSRNVRSLKVLAKVS